MARKSMQSPILPNAAWAGMTLGAFLLGICCNGMAQGNDTLTVLEGDAAEAAGMQLRTLLNEAAYSLLDSRREAYEALETPEEIAAWQSARKEFFVQQLGGFPERTPLNARVVGGGKGQGFRYEKVLYDSMPGFTVSAILYLPETEGPYPGVLLPCGHSANGKASELYQRASILLAMNGMATLCYDPIGQGERYQNLDAEGKALYGSTVDHMMVGAGSILVGRNTATYRIYDGMRGIDYLTSRPDIDPERIGCTGNSGGGTLTSYIMALDERVRCAAPSCYLTTFRRLLETIGPQDAEQDIFGQIAFGMDHPDYVIMRAPKPTLMCVATEDFFDITGAWDNFRQGKRIYTRLGYPERVSIVETDRTHGFSEELRQGMVRWMRRWLLDKDDAVTEAEFGVFPDEALQCTPKGQMLLEEGQRSVYDFNVEEAARLTKQRKKLWIENGEEAMRGMIRETSGIAAWEDIAGGRIQEVATLERPAYKMKKVIVETGSGAKLPSLLFTPAVQNAAPVLYLNGAGKAVDAGDGGPIAALAREGHLVLVPDLSGMGELTAAKTRSGRYDIEFSPLWYDFYVAYLSGRSITGIQAEEIFGCAKYLGSLGAGGLVQMIAVGEAVIPALHAAALERSHFSSVEVSGAPIASWSDLVAEHKPGVQLVHTVHGALRVYDLPDLARVAGVRMKMAQ